MDRHSQLKSLADSGRLYALADATPKSCVQQDHIDGGVERVCRELLKVDYHCVRRQRHPDFLSYPAHSVQTVDRILQVVVANIFNLLPEPDRGFGGPDAIWIEAKAITIELRGQSLVCLQLIFRGKDAAFQFV